MTDTITLPRATVQQALEALETYKNFIDDAYINEGQWHWLNGLDNAQTALKAALEQQAEPVAPKCAAIIEVFDKDWRMEYLSLPVGKHKLYVQQYTYTAQPQRKELSAGEILNMMPSTIPAAYDGELMEFARAIEAKIKEGT